MDDEIIKNAVRAEYYYLRIVFSDLLVQIFHQYIDEFDFGEKEQFWDLIWMQWCVMFANDDHVIRFACSNDACICMYDSCYRRV